MKRLAALVLAAGGGRRMGQQKALTDIDGTSLVRGAVEAAMASQASEVFVVVGHQREKVANALARLPVTTVDNRNWRDGLSGSLRAGIAAVEAASGEFDAVLIVLADQPLVGSAVLNELISAAEHQKQPLATSVYAGSFGPPALLSREFFEAIQQLSGDRGARSIFEQNADRVAWVDFPQGAVDLDTPEDVERFLRSKARRHS